MKIHPVVLVALHDGDDRVFHDVHGGLVHGVLRGHGRGDHVRHQGLHDDHPYLHGDHGVHHDVVHGDRRHFQNRCLRQTKS